MKSKTMTTDEALELADRLAEWLAPWATEGPRVACTVLSTEVRKLRAELDALKAWKAEVEKQEPVEWQSRSRPSWGDHQWSEWASCSTGYAEDITKSPELHDWQYEARALYALPGAQPAPSVTEGWKLVPTAESRHPGIYKMLSALHVVDNTPGASEWESYAAFLAVAPDAKT